MSVEDVCELSSLYQGDETTKEFMSKRILVLESAIHQQGLRFQHEIDEYRRILGDQETVLENSQTLSDNLDYVTAQINVTSQEVFSWDQKDAFLVKVENYCQRKSELLSEVNALEKQIRVIEDLLHSSVQTNESVKACILAQADLDLSYAEDQRSREENRIAGLKSQRIQISNTIEATKLTIQTLEADTAALQKDVEDSDKAHEKIDELVHQANCELQIVTKKHFEVIAKLRRNIDQHYTDIAALAERDAHLIDNISRDGAECTKHMSENQCMSALLKENEQINNSTEADISALRARIAGDESIIRGQTDSLHLIQKEKLTQTNRTLGAVSTSERMEVSAAGMADEVAIVEHNLQTIRQNIAIIQAQLGASPIASDEDLVDVGEELTLTSKLQQILQRIDSRTSAKLGILAQIATQTEHRGEALAVNDEFKEKIDAVETDKIDCAGRILSATHSRQQLMDAIDKLRNELEGRPDEASLLRATLTLQSELEESIRQRSHTKAAATEYQQRSELILRDLQVTANDLKDFQQNDYIENKSQQMLVQARKEALLQHQAQLDRAKREMLQADDQFKEAFARAQGSFNATESRLLIQIDDITKTCSDAIRNQEQLKLRGAQSLERLTQLRSRAHELGISNVHESVQAQTLRHEKGVCSTAPEVTFLAAPALSIPSMTTVRQDNRLSPQLQLTIVTEGNAQVHSFGPQLFTPRRPDSNRVTPIPFYLEPNRLSGGATGGGDGGDESKGNCGLPASGKKRRSWDSEDEDAVLNNVQEVGAINPSGMQGVELGILPAAENFFSQSTNGKPQMRSTDDLDDLEKDFTSHHHGSIEPSVPKKRRESSPQPAISSSLDVTSPFVPGMTRNSTADLKLPKPNPSGVIVRDANEENKAKSSSQDVRIERERSNSGAAHSDQFEEPTQEILLEAVVVKPMRGKGLTHRQPLQNSSVNEAIKRTRSSKSKG